MGKSGGKSTDKSTGKSAGKSARRSKQKSHEKSLEVISNPLISHFITSSLPKELRSPFYPLQASLGIVGILLIFSSFRIPLAFFPGALLLLVRRQWRQKTDAPAVTYKKAIQALRKKQYAACIESLTLLMSHSKAPASLLLVIASCYLEQENSNAAYQTYHQYFTQTVPAQWNNPAYWSSMENYLLLSLERDQTDVALLVARHLPDSEEARRNAGIWKSYYIGRTLLAQHNWNEAKDAFEVVLSLQSSNELPALDAAYQLALIHWQQGQPATAREHLLALEQQASGYKNVSHLLAVLKKPDPVFDPAYIE